MKLEPSPESRPEAPDADAYRANRIAHWNGVARSGQRSRPTGQSYHRRLEHVYRFLVPPGLRVLDLGCGEGDLLASLAPAEGVGVDFSPAMIEIARQRHPNLEFIVRDAQDLGRLEGPCYGNILFVSASVAYRR